MKRLAKGVGIFLLTGFTACEGVDSMSTDPAQPTPSSVERVSAALNGCGWGDGNYTRVGDTNGDHRVDLLSPVGSTVNVYESLGTSMRWLQAGVPSGWGSGPYTWAGDFDGDGRADLLSGYGSSLYVKQSGLDANIAYSNLTAYVPNVWGPAGYTFAADFTGDGRTDVATASNGTINLFVATGSGPYSRFQQVTSYVPSGWGGGNCGPQCPTPSGYTWAADFDGDGLTDIASASGSNVMLARGSTSGTFSGASYYTDPSWGQSGYTFAGRFLAGGRTAIASASGGNVYIKFADLSTQRFLWQTWPVQNSWGSSDFTFIGDFDGNGLTDIASANGSSIYVKLSTGTGFVSQTWTGPSWWGSSQFTRAADFDGDGKTDILTASGCSVVLMKSTGSNFSVQAQ